MPDGAGVTGRAETIREEIEGRRATAAEQVEAGRAKVTEKGEPLRDEAGNRTDPEEQTLLADAIVNGAKQVVPSGKQLKRLWGQAEEEGGYTERDMREDNTMPGP